MADLDRLAKLSPEQRTRLQERLVSRAAVKLRAAAEAGPAASQALPPDPTEPGEPVAIVGMACRFGGAPNLDAYWRLIRDGLEGVVEVPADRWAVDDHYDPAGGPGKSVTRRGAFVTGIDQFEPTFFGVTPREASRMDPQQRMLLEVAWETLENAGWPADRIAGAATGVYVGVGGTDYKQAPIHTADYFQLIDAHVGTGNALSIASNRVSYALDLRGPSLSVDTACSSSSLAIHLAVESLRRGECTSALAGGVNAIITPETTIAFSQAHMLSPEGRCRSYDASAAGYVRGEGCAFVMLKRLADAERDGDQVLAVLAGSAVNQDGRTAGISAPSVTQQQACLQAALADAGLSPDDVDYVEGHGTGTPLGDPVELQALAHVFRRTSAEQRPLWVTSVKSNIGHTETVSGAAGLIKTVLLLQNGYVPPQLHLERLNPHAHLEGSRVTPLAEGQDWPSRLAEGGRPRVAGVSSFGFGGTNTHLVVTEAPAPAPPAESTADRSAQVLKLAAKTPDRIPEQAKRLAEWMRNVGRDANLADIAFTQATGRCDFPHRVALVAESRSELLGHLDAAAAGKRADDALVGREAPRVVWMFTGQGAQRVGMGRGLYNSEPVFRRVVDRCDAALAEVLPDRLVEVLYSADDDDPRIHQTRYTQPALFAVECGLAALWKSWGVTPDVVLGHSIGEYAAAVTAGVLSLEDGARLVGERGRLMHSAQGDGAMAVAFAGEADVAPVVAGREASLAIAAVNGPQNTVISGDSAALDAALDDLAQRRFESKRLVVSHAFHSPLMDPVLDEFERSAALVEHRPPRIPIASNLTGELLTADNAPEDWARYWRDHLRGAVRFADGVRAAAATRATHWIEIGPAPVLAGMAVRCEAEFAESPRWIASLRPGIQDSPAIAEAIASHWAGGGDVNWRSVWRGRGARRLPLPNYPWRRERFWYENLHPRSAAVAQATAKASPALGGRLPVASGGAVFETPLDEKTPTWLADHQVRGAIVAPAAMFVEQALAAAAELAPELGASLRVDGLAIRQALVPTPSKRLRVQTLVERPSNARRRVSVHSAPADEPSPRWTDHAEATIVEHADAVPAKLTENSGLGERVIDRQERGQFYRAVAARGLEYGAAFRVLNDLQRSPYDATATLSPSKAVAAEITRYRLHPAIGDALLQTIAATLPLEADGSYSPETYLPVRFDSVRLHRPIEPGEPLSAYAVRRDPAPESNESSPETVDADAFLLDGAGVPIASLLGVRVQRMARASVGGDVATEPADWLYQVEWRPTPLPEVIDQDWPAGPSVVFADASGFGDDLVDRIESRGGVCLVVRPGVAFAMSVDETEGGARTVVTLDPADASHYQRLVELLVANPSGKPAAVVHAWNLDADDWQASERCGVGSAIRLVQQLARRGVAARLGTWLVTRNAQTVGVDKEAASSPQQAATFGLGRVAALEHPELNVRLFDLDAETDADALLAEMAATGSGDRIENQIASRGGVRCVARLAPAKAISDSLRGGGAGTPTPDAPSWRLELARAGTFDGLAYRPNPRIAPGPGQVEMEIHATGLNFSDVLKSLGLYPGLRDAVVPLGIEASGVVTAVGEGVDGLKVGDEAIGVLPHAFASHATTAAYAVVRKPATITHEQGATIPVVFLTAHYALAQLAQLERGERVLIHAAAGGVGLAALQIAQHAGAEVFATAGSDEKRDLLRSLGVRHVMDSRSLDFADEVRQITDGEGVDVVLNSLPGEAIDASLGLLRAYGRFCEIGKIDIYQDHKLGLLPFQDNLSYFAIDLDRMLRERPERTRRLFAEVMARFEAGDYRPLPLTRFAPHETADAFRYMSQRRNIGKVVVSMQGATDNGVEAGPVVRGGGYLVTGGLGAIGRRVARWLIDQGAGGVALLSRREPDDDARAFVEGLRSSGAHAVCLRGDISDRTALDTALKSLPDGFPRFTGVLHTAGVLDDGLLGDLDAGRLARVLRPKAVGAENLHEATLDAQSPLAGVSQFVLFSSVAGVLGSPGQANYAAANAALDALAERRRNLGLPATSIAWGPWASDDGAGLGMATGETADAARSKGMQLLPPTDALVLLGSLMGGEAATVAVFDARWDAMSRLFTGHRPPLLAEQLSAVEGADGGGGDGAAMRSRLLSASPEARHEELVALVRGELARVTSVPADEIDPAAPLTAIGIDSLMALELKNNLEAKLGITLPMGKLLAGPSVATLAEAASEELVGESSVSPGAAWRPLVVLREGADEVAPLFLMPVLGGDAGAYRKLVEALPPELPVIAIRPRGLDSAEPPHEDVYETARDYAAAIRERQPEGPYHLAGWSTGGITALAVAEQLQSDGAEVAGVALLDTPSPSVYQDVDTHDDAQFLTAILDFSSRFMGGESGTLSSADLAKLPEAERFAAALAAAQRAGIVSSEVDVSYIRQLVRVGEALVIASRGYEPSPLTAPVLYVSPEVDGGLAEVTDLHGLNVMVWREALGETLTEATAPGDHFSMMSGAGAAAIAGALSEARMAAKPS